MEIWGWATESDAEGTDLGSPGAATGVCGPLGAGRRGWAAESGVEETGPDEQVGVWAGTEDGTELAAGAGVGLAPLRSSQATVGSAGVLASSARGAPRPPTLRRRLLTEQLRPQVRSAAVTFYVRERLCLTGRSIPASKRGLSAHDIHAQ